LRTGAAFPRGRFEAAVHADAEVLAALYAGSLARGTADAFSDLDVELVLSPEVADPRAHVERLAAAFGRPRFHYWRDQLLTAFAGSSWQRLDLRYTPVRDLAPSARLAGARVWKDVLGVAGEAVTRSLAPLPVIGLEAARQELACAIDTQIYAALHIARGALWSAQGELVHRAQSLYALVAHLRGVEPFGFRHVESLLGPVERKSLERAWPREPRRRELRRAARALWSWTTYVRADTATRLGADPGPEVDAEDLLRAVEQIHARAS
jgi:hypothetical protein